MVLLNETSYWPPQEPGGASRGYDEFGGADPEASQGLASLWGKAFEFSCGGKDNTRRGRK